MKLECKYWFHILDASTGSPTVVMSLGNFKSYEETAYLITQLESGQGVEQKLLEE